MRPRSTRSPSFDRIAGSTVSEPTSEIATTSIVAMPKPWKMRVPIRSIPAIAVMTVRPETSTARPDVAAAISSAAAGERPRARSSRSRRR